MRVLVTGAGGQLGADLVDAFDDHDVVGCTRAELDVTDEGAVVEAITTLTPGLVVNAAAWTDVDGCESDPGRAHRVNALGPWWLARACRPVGATLVSVSTDYVFGGAAPAGPGGSARGWREADPLGPVNEYGRSKAAGEALVRETLREHHLVRTGWLAGARGNNFVATMLRLGRERGRVEVVDDQVGSPTFTRDLAAGIRQLAVTGRYGTVHLTNEGRCSWFDLAEATFDLAGLDVDVHRTSSAELDRPAPRPTWSALDGLHAAGMGLDPFPPWRDGLRRLLAELGEAGGTSAAHSRSAADAPGSSP